MAKQRKHRNSKVSDFFDYAGGKTRGKDRNAFERRLQKDPFEAEAAEGLGMVSREEMAADLQEVSLKILRRTRRKRRIAWYSAAAAVASLMIVATLFFNIGDGSMERYRTAPEFEEAAQEQSSGPAMEKDESMQPGITGVEAGPEKEILPGKGRSLEETTEDEGVPKGDEVTGYEAIENVAPGNEAIENFAPGNEAVEYVAPGNEAPGNEAVEYVAPENETQGGEKTITERPARREKKADAQLIQEDVVPQEPLPKDAVAKEIVEKDAVAQGVIAQEVAAEDAVAQEELIQAETSERNPIQPQAAKDKAVFRITADEAADEMANVPAVDAAPDAAREMAEQIAPDAAQEMAEEIAPDAAQEMTEEIAPDAAQDVTAIEVAAAGKEEPLQALQGQVQGVALSQNMQGQVSGIVYSADDLQPLPGVSLSIKGSNEGTVSDIDGSFRLTATDNAGGTLVARSIGMQTEEIPLDASQPMEIAMVPDAVQLDEVVVVGHASSKKTSLTSSVSKVEPDPATASEYITASPVDGIVAFKQYMDTTLIYPTVPAPAEKEVVVLKFSITPNGRPVNFRVIRSPGTPFTQEAIRVLAQGPDWRPTTSNGTYVEDDVRLRIVFRPAQQ